MTKRSLTTKTHCEAVNTIEIRFFNEAEGFIEEFEIEIDAEGSITICSADGLSEDCWQALCFAESELVSEADHIEGPVTLS